jgi:hypothetical protein
MDPSIIDKDVKNKFRKEWLDTEVEVTDKKGNVCKLKIGLYCQKSEKPGIALCLICNKYEINYSNSGKKALTNHFSRNKKHIENWELKFRDNERIESVNLPIADSNGPSTTLVCSSRNGTTISDRVVQSQSIILSFMAENTLPFSLAPGLIKLSKKLAEDPKALSKLTMDRTSASYKLQFGVDSTIKTSVISKLRNNMFSLNIDEATSSNHKRILAVLVSCFDPDVDKVVIEYLASIELVKVTSETVLQKICDLFSSNDIPWNNLVAILMDSCAVMRGSKSGFEVQLRTRMAPQLLDIDGDINHHIHNATKTFCAPFGRWAENLFSDLHTDFKWSVDLRTHLQELCELLDLKYSTPDQFIPHRWLSCYDLSVSTLRMIDAFTLLYFAFIPANRKIKCTSVKIEILRRKNVSSRAELRIGEILEDIASKKMTDEGKERKERIIVKLFTSRRKTDLLLNFYKSVLQMMKSYVMTFQSTEPFIYRVHDQIVKLFSNYLTCFVRPEELVGLNHKRLTELKIDDSSLLKRDLLFVGTASSNILSDLETRKLSPETVEWFYSAVTKSYLTTANYLQKKLPLQNDVLIAASAIDPTARGSVITLKRLLNFTTLLPACFSDEELEQYDLEVRGYLSDFTLPDFKLGSRVDEWWALVRKTNRYPTLCKLAFSMLSVFHGPAVESSFNTMKDILNVRSGNLNSDAMTSYQRIKYRLRARSEDACDYFGKWDSSIVSSMKSASACYRKQLKIKRDAAERRKRIFGLAPKVISKAHYKRVTAESAKAEIARQQLKQKRLSALRLWRPSAGN